MSKTILIILTTLIIGIFMFNLFSKSKMDIDAEEFQEKRTENPGVVIDVRTNDEYQDGHLAIADHQYDFTNGDFEAQLDDLNKDKTYYLYCRTGNRSGKAARLMKNSGFKSGYNIGGFEDLKKSGFETK